MKTSLIALALVAALPFSASAAENLSYNYAEGNYQRSDTDAGKNEGWGAKGSYGVLPNMHVFGDYSQRNVDNSNKNIDQWRLGVGYNVEIAPSTDFVARAAYNRAEQRDGLGFNGFSTEAGIRTAFGEHVEVYALAGYEDYSKKRGINPESELYGRLGGQVKLNQNWGVSGDLKMDRDGNKEWSVGPRFSW